MSKTRPATTCCSLPPLNFIEQMKSNFLELNGVRTDVTKEYQKSDRFKVQTMNGETYLMVNANLLKFSILWRVGDEDIFEEVITQLSNTFCPGAVCSQVRLNGTLKYDNTMYNDHKRIIEVVK